MASTRAIALKRAEAMARIEAATAALAERHGVGVPSALLSSTIRDPELARAAQLEAFADVLEQLATTAEAPRQEDADRILELEAELAQLKDEGNGSKTESGDKGGQTPNAEQSTTAKTKTVTS